MAEFTPVSDVLSGSMTGRQVKLRGWVRAARKQKEIVFLMLRDGSGILQVAIKGGLAAEADKLTVESSIELEGTVSEDKRAPGGFEVRATHLTIVSIAERWPIEHSKDKELTDEFLRDSRHLWVRDPKMVAMLKVRSSVFQAIRKFYEQKGYFEVQSPIFTTLGCEGGSTLFEVKYGERKGVYLAQSWQLYAEAMVYGLEKIFTISPSFRAEKSRTVRHLSEYWHHEMETAWMDHEQLMGFEEDLIIFVTGYVLEHAEKELKDLGRDTAGLKHLTKPFLRMTYKHAMEKLGKKHSDDITDKEERELLEKMGDRPMFLTSFSRDMKAFYMRPDPKDPKVVLASDLLLPGVGEVIGGSERIFDGKELLESLKMFKLPKKDYEWYLDLTKYGAVPHSGFGLGIERLLMWLTGAKHIFDTIPFPRSMDRVTP
ncbi:MAG: asparagine--tRNA ligase [Candidatus Aenigmatarchaeota archaeon]